MCGFLAEFNISKNFKRISNASESLFKNRGPDELIRLENDKYSVSFARLSITDISHGKQPFHTSQGLLAFGNGEVYNSDHLLMDLELDKEVADFVGHHDIKIAAEVLGLDPFQNWNLLDGMFAIVLAKQNGEIFYGRDRVGEKPAFYAFLDGRIILGSNVESIAKQIARPLTLDFNQVNNWLVFGATSPGTTLFKEIREVKPGHYLVFKEAKIEEYQYWSWPKRGRFRDFDANYSVQAKASVNLVRSKDCKSCLLWSGGIDSTAIREHIFADEEESTCIHISFMNKAFNENLAELITFSEQESVIDINFDEWLNGDEISQVIDLMDQPISDPACLPILAAAKWAKQNDFRVIFTGDGADEALRGYRAIQAEKLLKVLVTLVRIIPKWFIKFADENISRISDSGYLSFLSTLQRILNTRFVKREYAMMLLVSPNYCLPRHFPEIAEVNNSYTFSHLENYFQNVILPQIYLHKTDRIFAGLGIEARSPWLTRSFIENSMLLSKRFLKKAGKPLSQLLTQKQVSLIHGKHGLGVPIQDVIARLEKPDWHIPHISARKIDQLWTLASRGSTGVNNLIWSLYLLNRKIQFWKRLSILD